MSEQHTAGPWFVSSPARADDAWDYAVCIEGADGKPQIIAEAFGRSSWQHAHPSLANAYLIAAAPDLYEAIARLLPHVYAPDAADDDETGDDNSLYRAAIERARAAITKATGGA